MKMLCRGVLCGVVTFFVAGCDLAPEPSSIPTTMEILPNDTMIKVGDRAKLRIVVYDQDGEEIAGPPSWAPAEWHVTGPPGAADISPQGDVVGNKGSVLKLTAFMAGLGPAKAQLRISPSSVLISVPVFYFNQVNQNTEGTVPILANRNALLRVFATGDEVSYYRPNVRADFYRNGGIVHSALIPAVGDVLPTHVEEGELLNSYNAVIPGHLLQPGLELVIEFDPEGLITRKAGSRTRVPEQGTLPLNIVALKNHHQVLVPTIHNSHPNLTGALDWTRNLTTDSPHIRTVRNFMPIADVTVEAHSTLYTDADLNGVSGWFQWRREVWALWQSEGQKGNYYGVIELWYQFGVVGMASAIGWPPVSVGRNDAETFVHEVGHTMNLFHAACGVDGQDPNYPYAGGHTGRWGYNFDRGVLVSDTMKDVMTYCSGIWISDYHFARAMRHRIRTEGEAKPPPPPEKTLLLWGNASQQEVLLDPAFLIEAPPTEPATGGPYRLEGFGPAGELRFSFDFTPIPLEHGGADFLFTLPYDPDRDGTLERIVLSGPGGEDTLTPGSTPPMAIMRDGPNGTIRGFLRDWDGSIPPGVKGGPLQVLLSDGIPGGVR